MNNDMQLQQFRSARHKAVTLVPFFMAVRAAVRAHVTATQAARTYFDLAAALLVVRPARLVAVGGLSGSGKSTVAAVIAPSIGPAPGARVIGSDRTRKCLFGVSARTRLPEEAYRPAVSTDVYARLQKRRASCTSDTAPWWMPSSTGWTKAFRWPMSPSGNSYPSRVFG